MAFHIPLRPAFFSTQVVDLARGSARPSTMTPAPMDTLALRKLFDQVQKKHLSPDEAVERLRHLPFEDLGFAKLDHHRALRQGMPEVIFSQGKTPAQLAAIFTRLAAHGGNVLATRATEEQYAAVASALAEISPQPEYRPLARAITLQRDRK